jgi:hypothetical protein
MRTVTITMAAVHDDDKPEELGVLEGEEEPVGKDVRIEVYVGVDPDMLFLKPWNLYCWLGGAQLPSGLYRVNAQPIRRSDEKQNEFGDA